MRAVLFVDPRIQHICGSCSRPSMRLCNWRYRYRRPYGRTINYSIFLFGYLMAVFGYLMGVFGCPMSVLGYKMGVLGDLMAWRRRQAIAKWC